MKTPVLVGVLLLVLGVGVFAYRGVTYKTRDTIVDVGPIQATAEREKTLPLSPMLGGTAIAVGIVLVIIGKRKRPVF